MTSVALDPIFQSPTALIFLSAILIALPWLIPAVAPGLSDSRRRTLQVLRTLTGLVLIIAILRPAIIRKDTLPTEATITLLLDRSRSMTLPSNASMTRQEQQRQIVQQLLPVLRSMDSSLILKVLAFDATIREVSSDDEINQLMSMSADGVASDIDGAINASVQSASGKPLAGVILISDGVEVAPPSFDEMSDIQKSGRNRQTNSGGAASLLASLDVPLWTVPLGPPGDGSQSRDVEVTELPDSFTLFSGNESDVQVVLRSRSMTGKEIPVRVTITSTQPNAKPSEIAVRNVVPTGPDDSSGLKIPFAAPAPGEYLLEVAADVQDGETQLTNNRQLAFVDVRQGGGRILYLEGQPRPEQTFLLRSLRRFPDLQVSYRWIAADTKDRWPIDLGLVNSETSPYDVVIIGDLPAAAIGDSQLKQISQYISAGASLLLLGGINSFASGGYDKSPLGNVLPVRLDGTESDLSGDVEMVPTKNHPIVDLGAGGSFDSTLDTWKALPPLVGASAIDDIRVAPGVDVLLESPDRDPLLVVGEYGGGRSAVFAGDSTWQWWRRGKSSEHRRFWRQLILWLLDRDNDRDADINIELASRRFIARQAIPFGIEAPVVDGSPLQVSVIDSQGNARSISSATLTQEVVGDAQRVTGKLVDLPAGIYQFRASYANSPAAAQVAFQVIDQDEELRQATADHLYMSQLAAQTAASGGEMFLPSQLDELTSLISQLRRRTEAPVVQKHRLADTPSSAWPVFVLLAGFLGTEWYLRRKWGLA